MDCMIFKPQGHTPNSHIKAGIGFLEHSNKAVTSFEWKQILSVYHSQQFLS